MIGMGFGPLSMLAGAFHHVLDARLAFVDFVLASVARWGRRLAAAHNTHLDDNRLIADHHQSDRPTAADPTETVAKCRSIKRDTKTLIPLLPRGAVGCLRSWRLIHFHATGDVLDDFILIVSAV